MPKISLHREPAWTDKLRAYKILIDGIEKGTIRQNETVELDVGPGPRRVQLRIDFCASLQLEVDATGDVRLGCRSNVHPLLALYFLIFKQKEWIRLWRET